jgi:3-hydroxyacyl-CoA dehydrogenase
MAKHKPSPFSFPDHAEAIRVGNFEDDLGLVSDVDLILEAIVERLDIKRSLFSKLDALMGPNTIVASNTSGIRIVDMLEGRSDKFQEHFLVTHFFNPPRYMKLLELVLGPRTRPEVVERIRHFGVETLGKGIVFAKDTPNFVANRIGAHALMVAVHEMAASKLQPEDVDAITGVPLGRAKSATFRTADIVGLDTLAHVVNNCYEGLPGDEDRDVFRMPASMNAMVERKLLGDKTGGGFYRKTKTGIETLDPTSLSYRAQAFDPKVKDQTKALAKQADVAERLRQTVASEGAVGAFAWNVLKRSLSYSAHRVGEICDDITAIDAGMRWGYNWELGPFEIWDALGFETTLKRMQQEGVELPESVLRMSQSGVTAFYQEGRVYDLTRGQYVPRPPDPREVSLPALRRGQTPVLRNGSAEAWDVGDGILAVTFTSKANTIDADVIQLLHDAVEKAEQDFQGLLLANEGSNFSVGANLFFVLMAAKQKQFDQVERIVDRLQQAVMRLKYAQVPVVAAPFGMTVGGALEICLGCDAVQAALETYAGLVEVGVGLIPAGGGCASLLWRALGSAPDGVKTDSYEYVTQVFKNIAMARVATSAHEAARFGYFRSTDGVSFDRSRQLYEAKERLLGLAKSGYHPPLKKSFRLPGESGIATLSMLINTMVAGGFASEHDALISRKLATVLCGGSGGAAREVSEQDIYDLEREAFMSLCAEPKTQDRMQHMLETNKPLRN